jgi:putative component of toxin-antitoxin plasmid stabilization module
MPHADILVFQEANGVCPLKVWLDDLEAREPEAYAKSLERILRLSDVGYELRRPLAAPLRDGINELRFSVGRVNYRILYFFHGRNVAVLSHGLTKEGRVPPAEIKRAINRKRLVEHDPTIHTAVFDL